MEGGVWGSSVSPLGKFIKNFSRSGSLSNPQGTLWKVSRDGEKSLHGKCFGLSEHLRDGTDTSLKHNVQPNFCD